MLPHLSRVLPPMAASTPSCFTYFTLCFSFDHFWGLLQANDFKPRFWPLLIVWSTFPLFERNCFADDPAFLSIRWHSNTQTFQLSMFQLWCPQLAMQVGNTTRQATTNPFSRILTPLETISHFPDGGHYGLNRFRWLGSSTEWTAQWECPLAISTY